MSSAKNKPQAQQVNSLWVNIGIVASLIGTGIAYFGLSKSLDLKNAFTQGIDCNVNSWINCDTAFSSSFATLFGIPVAAWGLFFYIFAAVVFLVIRSLKNETTRSTWGNILLYMAAFSIAFSLVKAYQLVQLKVLCPVCLGMYVVNIAIFAMAWLSGFRFSIPSPIIKVVAPLGIAAAIFGFGYIFTNSAVKKSLEPQAPNTMELPDDSITQKLKALKTFAATEAQIIPVSATTPFKGGKDAKTVINVFSDFQCPGCKRGSDLLAILSKEFGDKIKIYDHSFPLDMSVNRILKQPMHPFAGDAAKLSVCAQRQGKYWAYHDQTFARQADIRADVLTELATNVGIDAAACLADPTTTAAVKADIEQGIMLGIQGTPAIFLNGKLLPVTGNYDVLRALIQKEVNAAK